MSNLQWWPTTDNQWRALGNHSLTSNKMLNTLGQVPDIPESEWREFDLRDDPAYPVKVKDQGQFGACNGHAAATSLEMARWISGQKYQPLSAWKIYAELCGGYDRGSSISDALELLEKEGTCEEPLMPPNCINPAAITAQARQNALRYRIEIGYRITTWRELCAVVQLRHPVNFSVPVNGNFNSLDKYDRPLNHAGAHNHAVTGGVFMKRLPTNEWVIGMQNSWSRGWGRGGFCAIGEKNIQGWGFDAYSVIATTTDPQNMPPTLAL